ncbi:Putative 16S rRNA processing protein RimM (Selenocysteine protein) (fragment) [Desulfamplus magnetovallimortis]|uniref:Putative 16S rRNA processing protein RimM (Selenocysteine protein) n=1 Tax=Desulfamplus magnetovallimortis TaxID=1246637 RepID=A0A1W1HBE8_9BACT
MESLQSTNKCPKCNFTGEENFFECPECGIIVSKFIARKTKELERQALMGNTNQGHELAGLKDSRKLFIQQHMEKSEVWLGIENRNRYTVNFNLFEAVETSTAISAILSRLFMGNWRPFILEVFNRDGSLALSLERPFRFFFHELDVFNSNGELLGTIRRQFGILRREYIIYNALEREIFRLFGPILHPWTFKIIKNGMEVGKITKKWSGFFKETFSKADDFGVEFPHDADISQKAMLMGAVFLIDFVHFER